MNLITGHSIILSMKAINCFIIGLLSLGCCLRLTVSQHQNDIAKLLGGEINSTELANMTDLLANFPSMLINENNMTGWLTPQDDGLLLS